MTARYKTVLITLLIVLGVVAYLTFNNQYPESVPVDVTPQPITLSGAYVCLPHLDIADPQTQECVFGLQTDNGDYYAVNFGAAADAMAQFQARAHITVEGFIVIKEALSSDQWQKYNMKGIFTITKMIH